MAIVTSQTLAIPRTACIVACAMAVAACLWRGDGKAHGQDLGDAIAQPGATGKAGAATSGGIAAGGAANNLARSARLPKLPSLIEMTGANQVDAAWIKKSEAYSAYSARSVVISPQADRSFAEVAGMAGDPSNAASGTLENYVYDGTPDTVFTWTAPNFFSRPLYFEQVNFERYEGKTPQWARPFISYGDFLGTIPVLPYKIGGARIHERMYTLGHWRPGDPTPNPLGTTHHAWSDLPRGRYHRLDLRSSIEPASGSNFREAPREKANARNHR